MLILNTFWTITISGSYFFYFQVIILNGQGGMMEF